MCHGHYGIFVLLCQEAKKESRREKENAAREEARGRRITAGMEGGRTLART